MNRGSGHQYVVAEHRVEASMRPRFMNRGSGPTRNCAGRRGEGFNEAPIHESGKSEVLMMAGTQKGRLQ